VPAGEYIVKAQVGGKSYTQRVTVAPGQVAFVQLVAGK